MYNGQQTCQAKARTTLQRVRMSAFHTPVRGDGSAIHDEVVSSLPTLQTSLVLTQYALGTDGAQ